MGSEGAELTTLLVEIRKDLLEIRSELADLRKQLFEIKSGFSDKERETLSKKEELNFPVPKRLSIVSSKPNKFSSAQLLQEGLKRGMFKKK